MKTLKHTVILLFVLLSIVSINSFVSASENITDNIIIDSIDEVHDETIILTDEPILKEDAQIAVKNVTSYYGEQAKVDVYLKDSNGTSINNKTVNIYFNGKITNKTTDFEGKVTLSFNLKPKTYSGIVKFEGDSEYNPTESAFTVKINKLPLAVSSKNFSTYLHSDIYFKVKIYNKITGKAISGIRVKFTVYSSSTKKTKIYYAKSNANGLAVLNKDLKVGIYKISAKIDDSKNRNYISYKNSNKKITMKVKPTSEWGCCSFYLQISGSESIAGFRRDSTEAANILIKNVKFAGKTAIKQYKTGYGYFVHSITTSDGWMVGNGGIDGVKVSKAIEKLAEDMVKSKKIKPSVLNKIKKYKKSLGFGHFSIKAPNGNFAVVWKNGYITGKLKPGEFFSSPNIRSYYRHSTFAKYDSNPVKAAIKVGATDAYGVNRRDITVFHWKATTDKNFKTTSQVKVYAANDNGKLVGRSTAKLKDNIYFKNKFFSKNKLPISPNMKFLGSHSFGNIDKIIKTQTTVKVPEVSNQFNQTAYFKATIKNKATGKVISGVNVKIKLTLSNGSVYYLYSKTDNNGLIKIDTVNMTVGSYDVVLMPNNNKYLISAKSKIEIKE